MEEGREEEEGIAEAEETIAEEEEAEELGRGECR